MAPNKSAKNGTANGNNHHNNNNNNVSSNNNNNHDKGKNGTTAKSKKPSPQKQKQIKIKKPKTRDSGCCSINFIKYVLIIIDIVFFVSTFLPYLIDITNTILPHIRHSRESCPVKKLISFPAYSLYFFVTEHFWMVKRTHTRNMDT